MIQDSSSTKKNLLILLFVFLILSLISGCVLPNQGGVPVPVAIQGQQLVDTAVASTLMSLTAVSPAPQQTSSGFLVYIPMVDSGTGAEAAPASEASATISPTPSLSPTGPTPTMTETSTETSAPPSATPQSPTPAPCLFAKFIQDINVPAGTVFTGGTKFTKIWRVKNVGSCTWNTNYTLIWVSGDSMGAKDQVALSGSVPPGKTIDLMIDLVAPKTNGTYKGAWMINDNAGHVFGVGKKATDYLWVNIKVQNVSTASSKSSTPKATTKPSSTTAPTHTSAPPTATRTATPTPTATQTP